MLKYKINYIYIFYAIIIIDIKLILIDNIIQIHIVLDVIKLLMEHLLNMANTIKIHIFVEHAFKIKHLHL